MPNEFISETPQNRPEVVLNPQEVNSQSFDETCLIQYWYLNGPMGYGLELELSVTIDQAWAPGRPPRTNWLFLVQTL